MVPVKNKGGRPPGKVNQLTKDIQAWAQENADVAKKALLDLCKSKDERMRFDAAQAVLVRAYGAPKQALSVDAAVQVFAGIKIVIGSPGDNQGETK